MASTIFMNKNSVITDFVKQYTTRHSFIWLLNKKTAGKQEASKVTKTNAL